MPIAILAEGKLINTQPKKNDETSVYTGSQWFFARPKSGCILEVRRNGKSWGETNRSGDVWVERAPRDRKTPTQPTTMLG